jgi:Tfp pilus assembly protein PilX
MRYFNQKGVALMAVIFLMVVVAFTGIIFISLSSNGMTQSVNEIRSNQAFYIAEAGMERARGYLAGKYASCPVGGCTCASINGNALFTQYIGQGQFSVISSSLGGQCTLTSTGGVPNISSGTTQRVVTYTAVTTVQDAWAVGYNVNLGGGNNRPFMAHWNGAAWSNTTATAPTIGNGGPANLMEVSMINATDGWAVSDQGDFIRYNGAGWVSWTLSTGYRATVLLNSIYMNSTTDGWAVGNSGHIERWNGTSWKIYPFTAQNTLQGVYCFDTTHCWGVGRRLNGNSTIIRWDGVSWTHVNDGLNVTMRYVSCADTNTCWSVGSFSDIIFYNNPNWVSQNSPGGGAPRLWGVDCVDSLHCWAVGDNATIYKGIGSPMAWSIQAAPAGTGGLTFVSCVTLIDCWASGYTGGFGGGGTGILIHYDGTSWTSWAIPAPTAQINSLSQFRSGNSTTSWKEVIQ